MNKKKYNLCKKCTKAGFTRPSACCPSQPKKKEDKEINFIKRGFFVHHHSSGFADEVIELDSYINVDGYIVGVYDGQHYASPKDAKVLAICTLYPVPKNKQKEKKEQNDEPKK